MLHLAQVTLDKSLTTVLCLTWMLTSGLLASDVTDAPSKSYAFVVLPCHDEWDPSPCTCYGFEDRPKTPYELRCSDITSLENFQAIFSKMKRPIQVPNFILRNSSLKILPAGLFGKVTFKYLNFYDNSIEKLEPGLFQGMEETLLDLTFVNNKIKVVDFLSGLQALRNLFLMNEPYEEIPDHGLANLYRLKYLLIFQCPVRKIGNYAFANTTGGVSVVNPMTVPIEKIGDYAFSNTVGGNSLVKLMNVTDASFSKNTFVGSSIRTLKVEGVTTLKEEIFSPVLNNPKRQKYTFRGTLKCDESMDWIAANSDTNRNLTLKCENGKTLEENIKARKTSS